MASNSAPDVTEVIKCPICHSTMRDPITYPCLHHFCAECNNKYCESQTNGKEMANDLQLDIPCPVCKSTCKLVDIKKDFTMKKMIEILTASSQKRCEFCNNENAEYKCIDCKAEIGKSCKDPHLKTPNCIGHTIKKLDEIKHNNPSVVELDTHVHCKEHSDKMIEFNCINCNVAMCYMCAFLKHKNCEVEDIQTALKKLIPMTEKKLQPIENDINILDESIQKLETLEKEAKEKNKTQNQEIDEEKRKLIKQVEDHAEMLRKQVTLTLGAKLKEIELQKEEMVNQKSTKESIKGWTETVLMHVKDVSLLTALQGDLMTSLDQHQQPLKPEEVSASLVKPISKQLSLKMCEKNLVGDFEEEEKLSSSMLEVIAEQKEQLDQAKRKMLELQEEILQLKQRSEVENCKHEKEKDQTKKKMVELQEEMESTMEWEIREY